MGTESITIKFARGESETYEIETPEVSRRPNQKWIDQQAGQTEGWILNDANRVPARELAEAIVHQRRRRDVMARAEMVFEKICQNKYPKPCADTGVQVDKEAGYACFKDGKWIVLSWEALCKRFPIEGGREPGL